MMSKISFELDVSYHSFYFITFRNIKLLISNNHLQKDYLFIVEKTYTTLRLQYSLGLNECLFVFDTLCQYVIALIKKYNFSYCTHYLSFNN